MSSALDGIRVLDLGANLAGPFGPQMLGDLGADVIKIEEIATQARTMGRGSSFFGCQRGKRSLAVDLKTPEGVEILHRLIPRTDVLHHNLRVGVAERLHYDYETVKALNPGSSVATPRAGDRADRMPTGRGGTSSARRWVARNITVAVASTEIHQCGTAMANAMP